MKDVLPAQIVWGADNIPRSGRHDDVYFSVHGGLEEARCNFINACRLPQRWQNSQNFCIAELGFGTGLNFLASIEAWLGSAKPDHALLDFVSFEKYPMMPKAAHRALANFPRLSPWIDTLIRAWPAPISGTHSLHFPEWQARLILHFGDIAETLPNTQFHADAWFLDGFSPAKNPDMWAESLMRAVAQRSVPGARLGTFTVARHVRQALEAAGFKTAKKTGFGSKRHRMEAHFPGLTSVPKTQTRPKLAILGTGIAGASLSARLTPYASIDMFEWTKTYPNRASANPLALVIPRLDLGESPVAKFCRSAYLHTLGAFTPHEGVQMISANLAPRDAHQAKKFIKLRQNPPLPRAYLDFDNNGLTFPQALLIHPKILTQSLLKCTPVYRIDSPAIIDFAKRTVNGQLYDGIVLANGPHIGAYLPNAPIRLKAGQIDWAPAPPNDTPFARNNGHYALSDGQIRLWGSNFTPHANASDPAQPNPDISQQLKQQAATLIDPEWLCAQSNTQSRASLRATTPNHLPIVGAVPQEWLGVTKPAGKSYLFTGLGSRGFGFASLCADILASLILRQTLPVSDAVAQTLYPRSTSMTKEKS